MKSNCNVHKLDIRVFNVTIDHHLLPFYRKLISVDAKKVKIVTFQDDHAFINTRAKFAESIIDRLTTKISNRSE